MQDETDRSQMKLMGRNMKMKDPTEGFSTEPSSTRNQGSRQQKIQMPIKGLSLGLGGGGSTTR